MDKKKLRTAEDPDLHEDLSGFSITINEFGEMVSSLKIEDINKFLNEHMDSPKSAEKDNLAEEE